MNDALLSVVILFLVVLHFEHVSLILVHFRLVNVLVSQLCQEDFHHRRSVFVLIVEVFAGDHLVLSYSKTNLDENKRRIVRIYIA